MFLDVTDVGNIKLNFGDAELDEIAPEKSCALDIADLGGGTLEDIGQLTNLTRERIRQLESDALNEIRRQSRYFRTNESTVLRDFADESPNLTHFKKEPTGSVFAASVTGASEEDEFGDDEPPTRISFFSSDAAHHDELVTSSVWNMFARWQNGRGFDCRTRSQKKLSRAVAARRAASGEAKLIQPPTIERESMTATNGAAELSPRLQSILDAFVDLSKTGEASAKNIAKKAKVTGANEKVQTQNVYAALASLRKKNLLPPVVATPSTKAAAAKINGTNGIKSAKAPASGDPILAGLIAKRDALADRVAALTIAIDAWDQ